MSKFRRNFSLIALIAVVLPVGACKPEISPCMSVPQTDGFESQNAIKATSEQVCQRTTQTNFPLGWGP